MAKSTKTKTAKKPAKKTATKARKTPTKVVAGAEATSEG